MSPAGPARLARPLRALARHVRPGSGHGSWPRPGHLDSWLHDLHHERLAALDAACADEWTRDFSLFADLESDVWALLLTQEYDAYPNIRALLPDVPDPSLQELWNGTSGVPLAQQGRAFYDSARRRFRQYSERPLTDARLLDFGCGWGRLTRFFVRDVAAGHLYACDPVEQILDECRGHGVPATLARTAFLPDAPPFKERFALAISFSVFTHISEAAHEHCLRVLYESLAPGGILILTVRPPEYLGLSPLTLPLLESLGPDPDRRLTEPLYLFRPHSAEPSHMHYEGGEMTYGETVITIPYIRSRWSRLFDLLAVDRLDGDPYQRMVTLRRR